MSPVKFCEKCDQLEFNCSCPGNKNKVQRNKFLEGRESSKFFIFYDPYDIMELQSDGAVYNPDEEETHIWNITEGQKTPNNIMDLEAGDRMLVVGKNFMIVGEIKITRETSEGEITDKDGNKKQFTIYYKLLEKFENPVSLNDEKLKNILRKEEWNAVLLKANFRNTIRRADRIYPQIKDIIENEVIK